jgi:hypothetical protein
VKPLAIDRRSLRQCPKCQGWTCLDHATYRGLVVLGCGHQVPSRSWDLAPRWTAPDKAAAGGRIASDLPSFEGPEMMPLSDPEEP